MGRQRRQRNDEEPCCDGDSLKIPCVGCIPPFRLHYMLILILGFCFAFWYVGPNAVGGGTGSTQTATVIAGPGGQAQTQYSPMQHSNVIYVAITIFCLMICATILHEGGHAAATMCAPAGQVRHIMLNPCCGGHAFVGHQGGELWEAWVAFAGPIWDITIALVIYFIRVSVEEDSVPRTLFLHSYLPMETKELDFMKLAQDPELTVYKPTPDRSGFVCEKHFLDTSHVFWQVTLAILMDLQFATFCFNMLPIMTLDGADFFGSWVRLCTTPLISAIFIITTSVTLLSYMMWAQIIQPIITIRENWDGYKEEPKWRNKEVYMTILFGFFALMKLWDLLKPTVQLISRSCADKLYKYHVFQDHEGMRRENRRRAGCPERVIEMPPRRDTREYARLPHH